MPRASTVEEFLSRTASRGGSIGDDVPPAQPPPPIAGVPAMDPMRPWRDLDVSSYIPLAEWLIAKPFDIAAERFGKNADEKDLLKLDETDRDVLRPALTEATQKCLYDLKLSALLKNPYIALAGALAIATGAKVTAIQLLRKREKEEGTGRRNAGQQQQRESAQSTSGDGLIHQREQFRNTSRPSPNPSEGSQQRGRAASPLQFIKRDSSTTSTRAEESEAEYSLLDSLEAVSLSSSYDELEDAAAL